MLGKGKLGRPPGDIGGRVKEVNKKIGTGPRVGDAGQYDEKEIETQEGNLPQVDPVTDETGGIFEFAIFVGMK